MLTLEDIKKIKEKLPYFNIKATFNLPDLQDYDSSIIEKVYNKDLYEEILYMNLKKSNTPTLYGGYDITVWKSKTKNHYIYNITCWGD